MRIEIKSSVIGGVLTCAFLFVLFARLDAFANDIESNEITIGQSVDIEKIKNIALGDEYDDVIKELGNPTHNDVMYKKMGNEVAGRRVLYIVEQFDSESFNAKKDRYLRLWFGPDDRLLEIEPNNQLLSPLNSWGFLVFTALFVE